MCNTAMKPHEDHPARHHRRAASVRPPARAQHPPRAWPVTCGKLLLRNTFLDPYLDLLDMRHASRCPGQRQNT